MRYRDERQSPFGAMPDALPKRVDRPVNVVTIYGLVDPRDNTLRYVGKSTNTESRLADHIKAARAGSGVNSGLETWIDDLSRYGMQPRLSVLEVVDARLWQDAERWWIKWGRSLGRLYNIEDGGRSPKRGRGRR